MLKQIPSKESLETLIGSDRLKIWTKLCTMIESLYDMQGVWNSGGKAWQYEYKYRRGGKTLCALYARENCIGFMVIFGKDERMKFEEIRNSFSAEVLHTYDEAKTYHDGKWVMFKPKDSSSLDDYKRLLTIKRKPQSSEE